MIYLNIVLKVYHILPFLCSIRARALMVLFPFLIGEIILWQIGQLEKKKLNKNNNIDF